jgi:hypothetical protein
VEAHRLRVSLESKKVIDEARRDIRYLREFVAKQASFLNDDPRSC